MAEVLIERVPSAAARCLGADLVDPGQAVQEAPQRGVGPGDVEVTDRCRLDLGLGCDHAVQHRVDRHHRAHWRTGHDPRDRDRRRRHRQSRSSPRTAAPRSAVVGGLGRAGLHPCAWAIDMRPGRRSGCRRSPCSAALVLCTSTVRPGCWSQDRELVLRNMLTTAYLPLAAIEEIAVRQVLAVRGRRQAVCLRRGGPDPAPGDEGLGGAAGPRADGRAARRARRRCPSPA